MSTVKVVFSSGVIRAWADRSEEDGRTLIAEFLRDVADQIKQQERIPQPGLWGVVEATLRGDEKRARLRYVRTAPATWLCVGGVQRSWDELIDPVLIREGVQS